MGRARESHHEAIKFGRITYINGMGLEAKRLTCGMKRTIQCDAGRIGRIPDDCYAREIRRNLLKKFDPFCAQTVFIDHKASGVRTRASEIVDKTSANWIRDRRK